MGSIALDTTQPVGGTALTMLLVSLAFLPVAVVMGLFSIRFSAQLINRFGPLAVLVAGQVVIADNLYGALDNARSDTIWAIVIFVFLALPGVALAGLFAHGATVPIFLPHDRFSLSPSLSA